MKICHICLCGPVTDGFTYQENLLSKYHAKLNMDVSMIASLYYYTSDGKVGKMDKTEYVNSDGVKMYRIEIVNGDINNKLRRYKDLYSTICKIDPDILFVHSCQFLDIADIIKFKKHKKDVRIYVDNHADFINSATGFLSKHILHGIIWRRCAKKIYKYCEKFYGVTPGRVDFLKQMYKLKEDKLELLVLGADDEKVKEAQDENARNTIREKYNIKKDDFLIMTGGKIDSFKKQTILLMDAVLSIPNVKLIVFGSVTNELKDEVMNRSKNNVQYIGWVDSEESYKYFNASDLVVFPGKHSVYWEMTAGLGIPMIVRRLEGIEHIDAGNTCLFLEKDSVEEIKEKIELLINNKDLYNEIKNNSINKGMMKFSYLEIAKRSIEL